MTASDEIPDIFAVCSKTGCGYLWYEMPPFHWTNQQNCCPRCLTGEPPVLVDEAAEARQVRKTMERGQDFHDIADAASRGVTALDSQMEALDTLHKAMQREQARERAREGPLRTGHVCPSCHVGRLQPISPNSTRYVCDQPFEKCDAVFNTMPTKGTP